jgi:hypothetical protein
MKADARRISRLVTAMQNHFLDRPGSILTLAQAQRQFETDGVTSEAVLDALVDARVLARAPGGAYVRFFPRRSWSGGTRHRAA